MELKDRSDGCFKDKPTDSVGKQNKDLNDLENQDDLTSKSDMKDDTSGSKVVVVNENEDLDSERNTKCQSDKCVRINAEDCSDESADESSKMNNNKLKEEDDAELDEEIIVSCQDDCKEINENIVTLRRKKKTSFAGQVQTDDEDYRYLECVSTKGGTSKRMVEIGSETLISDDDLRLAATLVHDAMEGRTVDIKTEPKYVKSYNLFKKWHLTYLLYITLIVDLSLVMFEEPAVQNFALSYQVTTCIEGLCLAYFAFRTLHHYHWRSTKKFFRDLKNIVIIGIICVTMIDITVYVIMKEMNPDQDLVRYSRSLRALLIVNFSDGRQIRRAWRNMRRTIKEIVHVLFLFFFFIFVFGLIAFQIFRHRDDIVYPDGKAYFKSYMDGIWDLYVLVTTSNNPDVMMPALDKSKFYCIFFFVYILVCFYMLLNVFLAVAYHSYNTNLRDEIKRSCREKKRKLGQAFDVIKVNYKGEDMVTYKTWKRLMTLAQPKLSKNQIDLLMLILDMDRSGHVGRREFMNVADLLNVPVSEVDDRITWLEKLAPNIYNSAPSEYVKAFVDSFAFVVIFDLLVVLEVVLIGVSVHGTNDVFCSLFILEILLKMYTRGGMKYIKKISNWFDIIITVSSLVIVILYHTAGNNDDFVHQSVLAVKIVRIFRILRLFVHIKRFKIIADTLINISMSILMYCGILFIIFYVFAILGMEMFKGKIQYTGYGEMNDTTKMFCGAKQLQNSSYYDSRYCSLNFNDFLNSVLVLSTILFENNWHIITDGFVLVSGVKAKIYFAIFFMCVSVVVMNIITAFVVDMFMYEYTIQKEGRADSVVEKKIKELGLGIDAETGLEISAPLSDVEMEELMKESGISQPRLHPWIEKATLRGFRNADIRFSHISSIVNKRKSSMPTLNRFDGIRFHMKKRGWTKIEVLLQQLYDVETESDGPNKN